MTEETWWTINDEYRAAVEAVDKEFGHRLAVFRSECPHPALMGWLQDWECGTKCWRQCCVRCFLTVATTYQRPDGATD